MARDHGKGLQRIQAWEEDERETEAGRVHPRAGFKGIVLGKKVESTTEGNSMITTTLPVATRDTE